MTPRSPTQGAGFASDLDLCSGLHLPPYRPRSILPQHFSAHRTKWPSHAPTLNITFISWLLFPVRCFIITNSNKGFFFYYYYLRYSAAFVSLASAVTSEDCIQGAKCAGPRVRAAEYTNLRKHRQ